MVNIWSERETVRTLAARSGMMTLAEELAWREVLMRQMTAGRTTRLLDIGTGTGWLPILMANRRLIATGQDISEPLLDVARQRAWEAEQNVTFVQGAADQLDFPNAAFDIVTAVNTFSALDNPTAVVAAVDRVLKPGGRLLVVEDDRDSADYPTFLRAAGLQQNENAPLWNANANEISSFLTLNGWQNISTSQMRGQLERTGTYRFKKYAIGYTLVVAEKGGSIAIG